MKTIYKLWFNTNVSRKSKLHEGYSVSVEMDGINSYYLDFREAEHWSLVSYADNDYRKQMIECVNSINAEKSDDRLLVADFTTKLKMPRVEWSAVLDPSGHLPRIDFYEWDGPGQFQITLNRQQSGSGNRKNSYVFIDDHNKLGLGSGNRVQPISPPINWDTYIPPTDENNLGG